MGVLDLTTYEAFSPAEIPFYSQGYYDRMQTLASGQVYSMGESYMNGHMYAIFTVDDSNEIYALYYHIENGSYDVLVSTDGEHWNQID